MIETIAVRKRFGNEWTDVRDFVRPYDYMVASVVDSRSDWTPRAMWQWVVDNIRYPAGDLFSLDWHLLLAFRLPFLPLPAKVYTTIDYWEFPAEVLRDREADCEGSAVLLCSMLRRAWPSLPAYVTVGTFKEYGHVWVAVYQLGAWYILDTTLRRLPSVVPRESDSEEYQPYWRFNDKEVIIESKTIIVPEIVRRRGEKDRHLATWYVLLEGTAAGRR